tara:strand:- start:260 stop:469 length:210 start_codon:yes stop_codon:yes gene_type:complete
LLVGLLAQAAVSLIALTPPVAAVIAAPDFGISTSDVGLFSTFLFIFTLSISPYFVSVWATPPVENIDCS